MDRRVARVLFGLMIFLGVLATCQPARADTGWARLEPKSDTYVKWRVALTMPEDPRPAFLRFYLIRKHRAIERARVAHVEWVAEVEAARAAAQNYSAPPPHSGPVNWDAIAACESGGRWDYNGSSGYDGGLQFLPSTWTSVMRASGYGFGEYAYQASRSEQIAAAEYLIGPMGANPWGQWPYCWRSA